MAESKEMQDVLKLARRFQQNYYELLPDWLQYNVSDYEYIKQNIAFALFGPPQTDNNKAIFHETMYDSKSYKIVDKIYNKMLQYGKKSYHDPIYIGILYNVIFDLNKKPDNGATEMHAIPVFRIKNQDTIWYIDNNCRIYKNWKDYLLNNNLPKCIMVLPKDGIYQCDPNYKITSNSSNVWIETHNSPQCATKTAVLKVCDIASNVLTLGATVGIAATSFVTPIGPALATAGLVVNGLGGAWTIARSTQKLVDRSAHKESVSLTDKRALSAWLGITGTGLTLGVNAGGVLLSRAVAEGKCISNIAKVAYNSTIMSNLTIHGISTVYQGYCLIEKYHNSKTVDIADMVMLTSHVLFFSNMVLNVTLANKLISSSQGTILEKFKNNLRFNRLRQQFNRIKECRSNSVKGTTDYVVHQLRKITNKEDFLSNINGTSWTEKLALSFANGKCMINNVELLDPVVLVQHLLVAGTVGLCLTELNLPLPNNTNDVMCALKKSLLQLVKQFYSKEDSLSNNDIPDISYFYDILEELKYMSNAGNNLQKIFRIAVIVIEHYNEPERFLVEAVYFVWEYSKTNLKQYSINTCLPFKNHNLIYNALTEIITFIHDVADIIGHQIYQAFYTYMLRKNTLLITQ